MGAAETGVAGYIAAWRPSSVTAEAARFARTAVTAAAPGGRQRAKNLLRAAGKLAGYGIGLGLDPVPEVLLHPSVIERFTAHGPGLSGPARRTLRTNLQFLARAVVPALCPADAPLPRERAKAPYSPAEISGYLALADAQPTAARRMRAAGLVCLGAGAGLIRSGLRHVRGSDVVDTGREIFVETQEKPQDVALTDPDELEEQEEQVLEHANELPITELAKMPESQTLEFKSSLRYDAKTGGANKALEQVIVKSVAGLTNARGGVLLIGVADDGEIVGLEKDVQMLPKRQDVDGYENHLTTLLDNGLGAAATSNVHAQFEQVDGHTVCRVTVQPSSSPVWTKIKGQEDALYVRLGNSTRPFGPRDAHEYISHHFR